MVLLSICAELLGGWKMWMRALKKGHHCAVFHQMIPQLVLTLKWHLWNLKIWKYHILLCLQSNRCLKDKYFRNKSKIMLAAVKGGIPDLTLTKFEHLQDMCGEYSSKTANCNTSIYVERLSVTEYKCRGLENLHLAKVVFSIRIAKFI